MSLRFLLDTNILSEPLKKQPDPGVMKKLEQHKGQLATGAPVWHELVYGCKRLENSNKKRVIERYLEEVVQRHLPILPYGHESAEWHASERARLVAAGRTPPFADGQIAAVAKVNDLVLVTINTKDYRDFRGIRLADWRATKEML